MGGLVRQPQLAARPAAVRARRRTATSRPPGRRRSDAEAVERLEALAAAARRPHQRRAGGAPARAHVVGRRRGRRPSSAAARFDRELDRRWRRTSYSDLTAGAHEARVASEPEEPVRRRRAGAARARPPSPARGDDARCAPCPRCWPGCRPACTPARSCTACSSGPTSPRPTSSAELAAQVAQARRHLEIGDAGGRRRGLRAALETPLGPLLGGLRLRDVRARRPARRARLRAAARGRRRADGAARARRDRRGPARAPARRATRSPATPTGSPTRRCAGACAATSPAASTSSSGRAARFAIADYKTNWLAPPGRGAERLAPPAGRARRRDGARALRPAGAALHGRAAPLPALAPARLRPRAPPRGRPLPVRARHDRARHAARRRRAVRRLRLAAARRAGRGAERRCSTRGSGT